MAEMDKHHFSGKALCIRHLCFHDLYTSGCGKSTDPHLHLLRDTITSSLSVYNSIPNIMLLARFSSSWRASVPSRISRCHANRPVAEFRPCGRVLHRLDQRPKSTQAGVQSSKEPKQHPADSDETPSISWPEPISWSEYIPWSEPYKSPGVARGKRPHNIADQIQDQLHADGHYVWGLVLYRCTYGDDAAWRTFLERIHASIRRKMEFYHGLDLLEEDRFKLTVLDDASRFDGAGVQLVREHFKEWRKRAIHEEQGTSEEIEARRVRPDIRDHWSNTYDATVVRYRFCVRIDEAALHSIVSTEGEGARGEAWVNLVEADWDLAEAIAEGERELEQARIDHIDMGGTLEDFDVEYYSEVFPEIEGCSQKNVGWMKVQYKALIPAFYTDLQDPNTLHEYLYERPPGIGTG